ncbi:hypothetical protein CPB84DRAFT_1852418 [Gymnopilus junonius]|uniref:Uncharacterized protein n=1 Tax=Gymnopilus junonius TaxID=109634 RepID=A0A9P5NE45_GYMJU|nr:hypothetical protein CPB84DRAFT_1852418 [Gymnopilus junonius]
MLTRCSNLKELVLVRVTFNTEACTIAGRRPCLETFKHCDSSVALSNLLDAEPGSLESPIDFSTLRVLEITITEETRNIQHDYNVFLAACDSVEKVAFINGTPGSSPIEPYFSFHGATSLRQLETYAEFEPSSPAHLSTVCKLLAGIERLESLKLTIYLAELPDCLYQYPPEPRDLLSAPWDIFFLELKRLLRPDKRFSLTFSVRYTILQYTNFWWEWEPEWSSIMEKDHVRPWYCELCLSNDEMIERRVTHSKLFCRDILKEIVGKYFEPKHFDLVDIDFEVWVTVRFHAWDSSTRHFPHVP